MAIYGEKNALVCLRVQIFADAAPFMYATEASLRFGMAGRAAAIG